MNNINIKTEYDIHKTCLGCLKIENELHPIYEPKLKDLFLVMTNFEILDGVLFPSSLCVECVDRLNICYSFREQCIKSYNTLKANKVVDVTAIKNEIDDDRLSDFPLDAGMGHFSKYEPIITLSCAFSGDLLIKKKEALQCAECNKEYTTKKRLNKHINQHGQRFMCDKCGKEFKGCRSLRSHLITHSDIKRFNCGKCNKSFNGLNNLKQHLRYHSGEKPFTCEHCGKSFTENGTLTRHFRTHTGAKPYVCPQCSRAFTAAGSLSRHLRIHAGIKPFNCGICAKLFSRASHLKTHMRVHSRGVTMGTLDDGLSRDICPAGSSIDNLPGGLKTEVSSLTHTRG